MRLSTIINSLLSVILLSGCNAIDKDEPVPSYIFIERIDLRVNPNGSEGTNAHDIQDAWVMANGELIGIFELPCRVPILKKDSIEIVIFAGVKVNGQINNRKFYPFYDVFRQIVHLEPTIIDTLTPVIGYKSEVQFPWVEDFEDFAVSMKKSGVTSNVDTVSITSLADEVFEYGKHGNQYTGKVNFRSKIGVFENSTIDIFDLPRVTSDIYLEVNYKSDVAVQFGLYPTSGATLDVGIPVYYTFANPGEWKKAYIRLSDDVNSPNNTGKKFRIFIHAVNNEDKSAVIFLDNIKLLHF